MSQALIDNLRKQIGGPRDGALLRFALANALFAAGDAAAAARTAGEALAFDADYTAAWKLRGKALAQSGDHPAAIAAFDAGIRAAEARGDIQAGKEMRVFRKRLQRKP